MAMENEPGLKMYSILKMVIFQPAHLSLPHITALSQRPCQGPQGWRYDGIGGSVSVFRNDDLMIFRNRILEVILSDFCSFSLPGDAQVPAVNFWVLILGICVEHT